MPAAAPSPKTTLAAGVRERILGAAKAEFAARGLRGASVRAIAARAGVTAAMINYYFRSKRALYEEVVEEAQARLFARLSSALGPAEASDLAPQLAAAYFDFLCEERQLQRLILREVLDGAEGVQSFVRRYLQPLRALFEELFGGGETTFQAAVTLFGAVAGYFLYEPVLSALLEEDPMSEESLARRRQHVVALASMLSRMETR